MRRVGRPPLDRDDESVSLHLRVPSKTFDQVYEVAQRQGVTMPELLRRALQRELGGVKKNLK